MYLVSRVTKANEGSYLCEAENKAGRTEDMIQVIVQEAGGDANYRPPLPSPGRPDIGDNSRPGGNGGVEVDRRELGAQVGGNAQLKCFIVGRK